MLPGDVQEAERPKLLERLGKWKGEALQQLLDVFDLPTPSKGTKVCLHTASSGALFRAPAARHPHETWQRGHVLCSALAAGRGYRGSH